MLSVSASIITPDFKNLRGHLRRHLPLRGLFVTLLFLFLPLTLSAVKNKDVDDLRFDELRCKIDPQSGPNSDVEVADIEAVGADRADVVDTRSAVGIEAG